MHGIDDKSDPLSKIASWIKIGDIQGFVAVGMDLHLTDLKTIGIVFIYELDIGKTFEN